MNEEKTYTSSIFNVSNLSKNYNYNNFNFKRISVKQPERFGATNNVLGEYNSINNDNIQMNINLYSRPLNNNINMDTWNSMKPTLPEIYIMSKKRPSEEEKLTRSAVHVPNNQLTPYSKLADINTWMNVSETANDAVKAQNRLKNLQHMANGQECYLSVLFGKKFDNENENDNVLIKREDYGRMKKQPANANDYTTAAANNKRVLMMMAPKPFHQPEMNIRPTLDRAIMQNNNNNNNYNALNIDQKIRV